LESIGASTWSKPYQAQLAEIKPPLANAEPAEANLSEVFEICSAEVNQRQGVDSDWFFDCGASAHVTGNRDLLTEIRSPSKSTVTTAGGKSLHVIGQGTAIIDNNKSVSRIFYVPGMIKNLLSVGKLIDEGYLILFGSKHCWVFSKNDPRKILLSGSRSPGNSLYHLYTFSSKISSPHKTPSLNLVTVATPTLDTS
jgi:hypothetical protein